MSTEEVSDGYHTFAELYRYRMLYNLHAALAWSATGIPVVRSKRHHDGEPCFGGEYFVVVAELATGQVSNHYKLKHWDLFRGIPEVDRAPEWDGHTPAEAADRLERANARMHLRFVSNVIAKRKIAELEARVLELTQDKAELIEALNKADAKFTEVSGRLAETLGGASKPKEVKTTDKKLHAYKGNRTHGTEGVHLGYADANGRLVILCGLSGENERGCRCMPWWPAQETGVTCRECYEAGKAMHDAD